VIIDRIDETHDDNKADGNSDHDIDNTDPTNFT
jgi:hypothetical protein